MAAIDAPTLEPLETHCEWRREELADGYVYEFTAEQLDELDAALAYAEAQADDVLDITRATFPLPALGPELVRITDELINGRGVVLLRGLPVEQYGKERASKIYWGVGTHLGEPWPQNAKGHLLGDVTDHGRDVRDPTSRGNEIGGYAFPFHSDGSDLVGLFCLDAGARGGASLVANAVTMHNDLVREQPDVAAELYEPMPYDLRGEQPPGAKGWYTMPVFSRCRNRLFVRYIRPYIESSRRHEDAPRPAEAAREAMNLLDAMCADPQYHVSMMLQPGDMQFVNNYHVLHGRDSYEDDRPAHRIRHLKRLWLETDLLANDEKPEWFRLGRTDNYWASKGRTKSDLQV
jgi:alpha-ketoglutarate-dependent taurine dioxygenase